jgi:hypothetical protein
MLARAIGSALEHHISVDDLHAITASHRRRSG